MLARRLGHWRLLLSGLPKGMAGVEGLEPPTLGLEIRCSILLSYTPSFTYERQFPECSGNCSSELLFLPLGETV
jgi:hypothetical protein